MTRLRVAIEILEGEHRLTDCGAVVVSNFYFCEANYVREFQT